MIVKQFFEALMAGKRLSNAAAWKNAQNAINLLAVIIGFAVSFLPEQFAFGESDITALATAAAIIGAAIVNGYLTVATSKKVGI